MRPEKRQLLHLKETGAPTPPQGAPPPRHHPPAHPRTPRLPKTLGGPSWAHQSDAQQSSGRCWSWARRRAPWANAAGHAKQRPRRPHPCLAGGSGRCLDGKAPGTPGRWPGPDLQGGPGPKGPRRLLLSAFRGALTRTPLTGRAPHTGCQLSTKAPRPGARVQAGRHTQGARELGFPPQQQERDSTARQRSFAAKGRGAGAQPRQPGGHTPGPTPPGPTPLKGRGQRYPPDYRGSPPSTSRRAQGARTALLTGRSPSPRRSQQAPRSPRLRPAPDLRAGRPGCGTPPRLQEPRERPRPHRRGGRPGQKQRQRRDCALRHSTSSTCTL